MNRLTAKVIGKVQGVWFRKYTRDKCIELDLTGWVKNNDDGDVELVAEGKTESLLNLNNWLMSGSPFAKVHEISAFWEKHEIEYNTFEIRK